MKANYNDKWNRTETSENDGTFGLCRKALALVEQIKATILSEHHDRQDDSKHLVQLALNEAEALAWQTDYPHLFFPNLAAEKLQAVGNWQARQRLLHGASGQLAFAA
jgi:hypothetical protein